MRPIYYDSSDPEAYFDNPNLRWGNPSYVLEPGDPGYVPPGGAGKSSRRRRKRPSTIPSTQTESPNTMDTFQYIVYPTPSGERFMPRPQYRGTKSHTEMLAEVGNRIGSETLTAALVIRTYHEAVIDFCRQGWKVAPAEDLLGYRFTCGGAHDAMSFPGTFDELEIAPSCNFGETGLARAADGFSGEKAGEQGRVSAIFVRVHDNGSNSDDHYTPDKMLMIELANKRFKFLVGNPSYFVKFKKTDGTLVTATEYIIKGSTIFARVPTPLTGSVELHLACQINDSVRLSIYQNPLLP
jgi:hypothetical protein